MPIRGRLVCHSWRPMYVVPVGPHHEHFGRNLYHMFVSGLFRKPNPLFCFKLWYSSCFEVKCGFRTFSKWCSHIPMWILILLDHRDCHLNSISNRCVSLRDDPIILPIRKINSKFSQRCLFHMPQVAFVFPPSHPFLQELRFLNHVSFYWWEASPSFSINVSYPVILRKMFFKFIILHSFSSPVDSSQAFSVDYSPFLLSNAFSCRYIS